MSACVLTGAVTSHDYQLGLVAGQQGYPPVPAQDVRNGYEWRAGYLDGLTNPADSQLDRRLAMIALKQLQKLLTDGVFDPTNDRHLQAADSLFHGALLARRSALREAARTAA